MVTIIEILLVVAGAIAMAILAAFLLWNLKVQPAAADFNGGAPLETDCAVLHHRIEVQ